MEKASVNLVRKYGFEFFTIFLSIFAAFALDNWNDGRKDRVTEREILAEIRRGLQKDVADMDVNVQGHKAGLKSGLYFHGLLAGKPVSTDSLGFHYFTLFRNFISLQNAAGYQSLKSKGLGLIENDSLRSKILSLYEYDYAALKTLEEDYGEMKFQEAYFTSFNEALAPAFELNEQGAIVGMKPLQLSPGVRNILIINLGKMATNRVFMLQQYSEVTARNKELQAAISSALN